MLLNLRQSISSPRALMWACFGAIIAAAWLYLYHHDAIGGGHAGHVGHSMGHAHVGVWTATQLASAFIMWSAMVFAMMLPSAAPMISTYMDIAETAREKSIPAVSPWTLIAGYVAAWLLFSIAATALQGWLLAHALLSAEETLSHPTMAAGVLIGAGLYQFLPIKHACLSKCASPMPFFLANWSDQVAGVFRIGFMQGVYCVGCCWALMLVMFVTGLMNLFWMAVIGIVMILEKTVAEPKPWSYGAGALLLISGAAVFVQQGL